MAVTVRSFEGVEDHALARVASGPPDPDWLTDGTARWVDVRGDDVEELRAWLAPLPLDPELFAAIAASRRRSHILHRGDQILLALGAWGTDVGERPSPEFVLCLPETVITFGLRRKLRADVLLDQERIRLPPGPPVSGVLLLLFELVCEAVYDQYLELRDAVDLLSRRLDGGRARMDRDELAALLRANHRLAFRCEERQYLVSTIYLLLAPQESTGPQAAMFKNTAANLDRVVQALDRLDRRLAHMQGDLVMSQQERANQRLRVLSIVSAIFLPLTLVAGIYGMNFHHMPELADPYAYPLTLGGMGLVAVGLLVLFWRKGWFS